MLCIRCGQSNASSQSQCGQCGAILPRNYGVETEKSGSLELEEGRNYDPPDRVYPNVALQALEDAVLAYYEDDAPEETVLVCLDDLERRLADLLDFLPEAQQAILSQQEADPDDLPHRIGYLLQSGLQRFNDAAERLSGSLSLDFEAIEPLLDELQLANDYICHSATLVGELFARDGQTVSLVYDEVPEEVLEG